MRRAAATGLTLLVLGAAAAPAPAQPPAGIARPTNESALSPIDLGAALYAGNCSTCHGIAGRGIYKPAARGGSGNVHGLGPSLRGVGALAADFYLRTGYMPLGHPDEQPKRGRVLFSEPEIRALIDLRRLAGQRAADPDAATAAGQPAPGARAVHQPLRRLPPDRRRRAASRPARACRRWTRRPPTQIAEAVRIGPYLMPRFSEKQITPAQLNSIVRYVQFTQHPPDRGGWGIGNLGPFPEGMVTWLLAALVLIATCMVIGKRLKDS